MVTSFIWAAFCCIGIPTALAQNLNSSIAISKVIDSDSNYSISTSGSVNIIETGSDDGDPKPLSLCYLPYLFSATRIVGNVSKYTDFAYENIAAVSLAIEHLNSGNGEIISELEGIDQRCPLRFVTKTFDAERQLGVGANHVFDMTDRTNKDQLLSCAILGAHRSTMSIPTSLISGLRGFPQISPISTSAALDDNVQFKLFGRTVPNDGGTAVSLLAKLAEWKVDYIAVLLVDDPYGNYFATGIISAAEKDYPNLRVWTVSIVSRASQEMTSRAIQTLKETGAQFFFGILYGSMADGVMTEAYNQGIAGTGKHTWIFSDGVGSDMTEGDFPVGSPLERAYRGTSVLRAVGGFPGEVYEKFVRAMQQLGDSKEDQSYVESLLPKQGPEAEMYRNYSIKETGHIAPLIFDAVVALGLASCGLASQTLDSRDYFTGEELYEAFLHTTFEGISGEIIIDPETGTRDPRSALYALTNHVDYSGDDIVGQGMVRFQGIKTDVFKSGEWINLAPFTFNDGSHDVPLDLPELVTNTNYLPLGWKIMGSILCGVTLMLSLGFSVWTHLNEHRGVVRGSQPIFLHIISAGTFLMGLSIIPLTIDLGVTGQRGANAACMSTPWLLAIGFSLTFSALFTKTQRIKQIMQQAKKFTRMKLTPVDVMKPMIALLLANIAVLAVWTAVDPLEWITYVVIQDRFLRDEETYGACSSDYDTAFIITLCLINFGSLFLAVFQAYKARHISTEFQESEYIFMAMGLIMVVSMIGIPVLVIAHSDRAAFYFVSASLAFAVSNSVLLLIFIPKVRALRAKNKDRNSQRGHGMQVKNGAIAKYELEAENEKLRREKKELELLLSKKTECSNLDVPEGVEPARAGVGWQDSSPLLPHTNDG